MAGIAHNFVRSRILECIHLSSQGVKYVVLELFLDSVVSYREKWLLGNILLSPTPMLGQSLDCPWAHI